MCPAAHQQKSSQRLHAREWRSPILTNISMIPLTCTGSLMEVSRLRYSGGLIWLDHCSDNKDSLTVTGLHLSPVSRPLLVAHLLGCQLIFLHDFTAYVSLLNVVWSAYKCLPRGSCVFLAKAFRNARSILS